MLQVLRLALSNSLVVDAAEDGNITEDARKDVDILLKQQFRPEFLNRLDEIVFYKPLTKTEIMGIVESEGTLRDKAERLVAAANMNGGRDNITVILVRVEG